MPEFTVNYTRWYRVDNSMTVSAETDDAAVAAAEDATFRNAPVVEDLTPEGFVYNSVQQAA